MSFDNLSLYCDIFIHRINNVFNIIQNTIEFSLKQLDNPEKIKRNLEIGLEQIKNGIKTAQNLRKLYNFENYFEDIFVVDICHILRQAIESVKKMYKNQNILFKIEKSISDSQIYANELLLDVFENILTNAIKYNKSVNIIIKIKLTEVKKNGNKFLKIEFIDNGIGIDENIIDKLFKNRIINLEDSRGLGIGLILVKKIIEGYNAEIDIENRIKTDNNEGTNVILLFPSYKLPLRRIKNHF